MIAIENNKTERGKLLAAVAVLALVACALVVVMPAGETDAETNSAVSAANEYTYDGYKYGGDRYVTDNTVTMVYGVMDASLITDNTVMNDFARFIGALYWADNGATVKDITYNDVVYTWNGESGRAGSNWENNGTTLVSVVTADFVDAVTMQGDSVELTIGLSDSSFTFTYAVSGAVAQIGDNYYGTLEAAIESAGSNDTIEIIDDANVYERSTVQNKTLTIDLNGHTLHNVSTTDGYILQVGSNASVTINGEGTLSNTFTSSTTAHGILATLVGGTLTLNNVTIDATQYGIMAQGYKTGGSGADHTDLRNTDLTDKTEYATWLYINGCTIDSVYPAVSTNGNYGFEYISITDSELNSENTGLYVPSNAYVSVTGTTINAVSGIDQRTGILNVSDSTINYTGPGEDKPAGDGPTSFGVGIAIVDASGYSGAKATTTISNVTFTGGDGTAGDIVMGVPRSNGSTTEVSEILNATNEANRDGVLTVDGLVFSTNAGETVGVSYMDDGNITVRQANTLNVNEDYTIGQDKSLTVGENANLIVNATVSGQTGSTVSINGNVSVANGGILDFSNSTTTSTSTSKLTVAPNAQAVIAQEFSGDVTAYNGSSVSVNGQPVVTEPVPEITVPETGYEEAVNQINGLLDMSVSQITVNGNITSEIAGMLNTIRNGTTFIVNGSVSGVLDAESGAVITATVYSNVTINGVTINNLNLSDISVTDTGVEVVADSVGSSAIEAQFTLAEGKTVAFNPETTINNAAFLNDATSISVKNVDVGTNGAVFSYGSVLIEGDLVFNGTATSEVVIADGSTPVDLVLGDVTFTGTGTVRVNEMIVNGTVDIAEGVVIDVAAGATLTVNTDGVITGAGKITLSPTGTITNNGSIEVEVDSGEEVKVISGDNIMQQFLDSVDYYDFIIVDGDLSLTATAENPLELDLTDKTIYVTGKMTVGANVYVNFDRVTFYGADANQVADNSGIIEVLGELYIADSDVYANVYIPDPDTNREALISVTSAKTMTIGGQSVGDLGDVGFGNILEVTGSFTIENRNTVNVYGTLDVAGTLTVSENATITVYGAGNIDVTGTMTLNGTLDLYGKGVVDGTVTASSTARLNVIDNGAFDVNGEMTFNGTLTGAINNDGTVTFAGTAGTGAEIMISEDATTTIASVSGSLTVSDTGAAEDNTTRDTDRTVDGNKIVITDMETVTGGTGVSITTSVSSKTENRITTYTATMDVAGAVNGKISIVAVEGIYGNGKVVVSQTLDVDGNITFDGAVDVTGTVNGTTDAVFTNNGTLTVTGEVTVIGADAANAIIKSGDGSKINATFYQITTAGYVTGYYAGFDIAIQQIANADNDTITVMGEQNVGANATIADGQTVVVSAGAEFTVNNGITLTVANGGKINDNAYNATDRTGIIVEGTLTFENYSTGYVPASKNYKIFADVVVDNAPAKTFMSLAGAIDAGMTDIVLNDDVVIKEDLTIPAGTKVSSDTYGITVGAADVENDVTLTVEGAVELTGTSPGLSFVAGQDSDGVATESTLVVSGESGYALVPVDTYAPRFTGLDASTVEGAHYLKTVVEDRRENTYYVISTVPYAAADSLNVAADADGERSITITGGISVGEVTFTAAEDDALTVYVKNIMNGSTPVKNSALVASSITLVGATLDLTAEYSGTVSGAVATEVGQIDLNRASGITITDVPATEDDAEKMTVNGTVTGGMTVSSGTVEVSGTLGTSVVEGSEGTITVSNGATLVVPNNATLNADNADSDDSDRVVIDGTVEFDRGTLTGDSMTVNGTMLVSENFTLGVDVTVNGTVDVAQDKVMTVNKEIALTNGAVLNGSVTLDDGYIVAYVGSDISGAVLNWNTASSSSDAVDTDYYVLGEMYATVYAAQDAVAIGNAINPSDIEIDDYQYVKGWFATQADADAALDDEGQQGTENNKFVGDVDAVYSSAKLKEVTIVVSQGTGLNIYIDNVAVGIATEKTLSVGTHTVSFDVSASYDGTNAVMTFNGQTIQNGGTITIDSTMDGYVLSVSGAVPSSGSGDITVNVPSQDDGMSLTDILLIVLVILIVIMAIIVALRLMRS